MWKRVALGSNTAAMIEMDVGRRYPAARCEMYLRLKSGEEHYWKAGFADAVKRLAQECSACDGLRMQYSPEHPYGMVCTALCDCPSPAPACRELKRRPRAMLVLVHNGRQDVLVGSNFGPGCAH